MVVEKKKVIKFAHSIGIDKIGFTGAEPLLGYLPFLIRRQDAGYRYAINEGDPEKRINPSLHLPGARSVICAALAYPGQEISPAGDKSPVGDGAPVRGRFSFISRGIDYHKVMSGKLEKLKKYICTSFPKARVVYMTDTDAILEKALAVKAGLGWWGKNTLLVTPEHGSWVCLGELISDIPFPADQPLDHDCGVCTNCIRACPTNALREREDLNVDRCLACLTLGKVLPDPEVRGLIGNTLYGCDACQQACPHNQKTGSDIKSEFSCTYNDAYPVLKDILQMSKNDFKRRFGHLSGAWRGRTPIQRNAVFAAGNARCIDTVPELIKILLEDSRPVMRGAAAWALAEIGGYVGLKTLVQARETEKDPAVKEEIQQGLRKQAEEFGGAF